MRKPTRPVRIAAAATAALTLATLTAPAMAHAATVDHYTVELKTWIPQASVAGPAPAFAPGCSLDPIAAYNGNDHVGYDGDHKGVVTYDFVIEDGRWADVDITTDFGETIATVGGCELSGRATSDAGVVATDDGVRLYIDASNPLVPGAPPTKESLDLTFASPDELVARHEMQKFPSQGFRVWRNGVVVATAVDFDASCQQVDGVRGAANIGKRLLTKATAVEHHIDTRVADQNYFGPCDEDRPPALRFPAA